MFDVQTFNMLAIAATVAIALGALGTMTAGVLLACSGQGLAFSRNEVRIAAIAIGIAAGATFVIGSVAALLCLGVT